MAGLLGALKSAGMVGGGAGPASAGASASAGPTPVAEALLGSSGGLAPRLGKLFGQAGGGPGSAGPAGAGQPTPGFRGGGPGPGHPPSAMPGMDPNSWAPDMTLNLAGATPGAPADASLSMASAGGNYDAVHLSSRNARLEEKLAKAMSKNRSMARYYDQLLVKTREAHEREVDELRARLGQAQEGAGEFARTKEAMERLTMERNSMAEELHQARSALHQADSFRREETSHLNHSIARLTEQLAAKEAEAAEARQRGGAGVGGLGELEEMKELLGQARKERDEEKAKDKEVARQLADIKEQALERIKENVDAQREIAEVREKLWRAENDRDEMKEKLLEKEAKFQKLDGEVGKLRFQLQEKEIALESATTRLETMDQLQDRFESSERERERVGSERMDSLRKVEELTDKLMLVNSEKEILVRHSAAASHVEAQLSEARLELGRYKRMFEETAMQRSTGTAPAQLRLKDLGKLLQLHIYDHGRWEKAMTRQVHEIQDSHRASKSATARLVAKAESDAAQIATDSIQVAQECRALLAQFSGEFLQTMNHITLKNTAHSQVQVRVAQQELAQARKELAQARTEADRSNLEARRAQKMAKDAANHLKAVLMATALNQDTSLQAVDVNGAILAAEEILGPTHKVATEKMLRRKIAELRFVYFGVAAWALSSRQTQQTSMLLLQNSFHVAKLERKNLESRLEGQYKISRREKAQLQWGLLVAGKLRQSEHEERDQIQDLTYTITQKTLQLQLAIQERQNAEHMIRGLRQEVDNLNAAMEMGGKEGQDLQGKILSLQSDLHANTAKAETAEESLLMMRNRVDGLNADIEVLNERIQEGHALALKEHSFSVLENVEMELMDSLDLINREMEREGDGAADGGGMSPGKKALLQLRYMYYKSMLGDMRIRGKDRTPSKPMPEGMDRESMAGARSLVGKLKKRGRRKAAQDENAAHLRNASSRGSPEDPLGPEAIAAYHRKVSRWNDDFAEEQGLLEEYVESDDMPQYIKDAIGGEFKLKPKKGKKKAGGGKRKEGAGRKKKGDKVGVYF